MRQTITIEQFGSVDPKMSTKCKVCGRRFGLHYDGEQPNTLECPITKHVSPVQQLADMLN